MGKHGASLKIMENMEKMENIKQITWNILIMIQDTLFVKQMTHNTLFTAFMVTVEKS